MSQPSKENFPLSLPGRVPALAKISRAASLQITKEQWNDWQWQVNNRLTTAAEIERYLPLTVEEKRAIHFSQGKFFLSLTPYWASQMDPADFMCPLRRQSIPLDEEFKTSIYEPYEFAGDGTKAARGRLTHLYPDRAIFSVHSQCIVYCRFCPQRKMKAQSETEESPAILEQDWNDVRSYLTDHPQIREVIISGGEPLLLNDELLRGIFSRLKEIPTVKTLRLESRIISFLPQRITKSLIQLLKDFQPLYLVLHVNHPREMSLEFVDACERLCDSGIPLASQTVLLRDLNDKIAVLSELFSALFNLRVRPYRLVQMLPFQGTEHFRTTISTGLKLIENLRGRMTGLSLPEYMVETAGGKIPLRYESVLSRNKKRVLLKNYEGKVFVYPEKIFTNSVRGA